jgi:hypothetical protein
LYQFLILINFRRGIARPLSPRISVADIAKKTEDKQVEINADLLLAIAQASSELKQYDGRSTWQEL